MKSFLSKLIFISLLSILILSGINCTSTRNKNFANEGNSKRVNNKIRGEAYLFDVKLKRNGKLTSFRLEIYQTDSITAFSGRGYLGKGALKGVIENDSILVYFPVSNEFMYESTTSLLDINDCVNEFDNLNVFDLLTNLPTELDIGSNMKITTGYTDADKPSFNLYNSGCSWEINVDYDKRKTGWRIKTFFINDGFTNMIKATRRTYKNNAKIPRKRFIVDIPDDAFRIIP